MSELMMINFRQTTLDTVDLNARGNGRALPSSTSLLAATRGRTRTVALNCGGTTFSRFDLIAIRRKLSGKYFSTSRVLAAGESDGKKNLTTIYALPDKQINFQIPRGLPRIILYAS